MSLERIAETSLWRTAFPNDTAEEFKANKEELRDQLRKFRAAVKSIVARIESQLPGLTIHDISHLDALWETASVVAGPDYPMNPLEAFVFGGAVLLHDSALCFEAYEGGKSGLRSTTTWRDALHESIDSSRNKSQNEHEEVADFAALRLLHAKQAEGLCNKHWENPETGEPIFLIESPELRSNLGQLIGKIAASHHWDIERVVDGLPKPRAALGQFPRAWTIDPVKLACLLRCADATHISSERAPLFLHALIKRQGISLNHWIAQNHLGHVDYDPNDLEGSSLMFTSTQAFPEASSEAWWVAYDAACLADKEIKSSNFVLKARTPSGPALKAKAISGIGSPGSMTDYIQVEGWQPCSARLHVSNVESLIASIGGENLYGESADRLEISLRELIQNSRDAIIARRVISGSFEGLIEIETMTKEGATWLVIRDNGVGMSKRVLEGPFLDFGTSFWKSTLVNSEFPGLRSSKFQPIGKYGIGFFSVFMIADEVMISSKPWTEGIHQVVQVHFKSGLSLRPILKALPSNYSFIETSTEIALRLKGKFASQFENWEIKRNLANSKSITVEGADAIAAICAGIDVQVKILREGKEAVSLEPVGSPNFCPETWLKRISFAKYQAQEISDLIKQEAKRLTTVFDGNRIIGFAAISTVPTEAQNFLSIRTIGGLASSIHARSANQFIGFLDSTPKSAKRDPGEISAPTEVLSSWLDCQLKDPSLTNLSLQEASKFSSSLCSFGRDPTHYAKVLIIHEGKIEEHSIQTLALKAETIEIAFLKSHFMDHIEVHQNVQGIPEKALFLPTCTGKILSLKFVDGVPENNFSYLDCLHRMIIKLGKTPKYRTEERIAQGPFGPLHAIFVSSVP